MNYIGSQSSGFGFAEGPILETGITLMGNSTNIDQNGALPAVCTIVSDYQNSTIPTARMIYGFGQKSAANDAPITNSIHAHA
jgi:hypothetical protein